MALAARKRVCVPKEANNGRSCDDAQEIADVVH